MSIVVLGVGNSVRGDDGVGLAAALRLEGRVPDGVSVARCEQEPTRLLDAWDGAWAAVIIDAVSSNAEPGTLHRFDASAEPVPAGVFRSSTHAFGVGDAIELARALGRLPERVVVYGVEGGSFAAGERLTAPVERTLDELVRAVADDLERLVSEEERCTSRR